MGHVAGLVGFSLRSQPIRTGRTPSFVRIGIYSQTYPARRVTLGFGRELEAAPSPAHTPGIARRSQEVVGAIRDSFETQTRTARGFFLDLFPHRNKTRRLYGKN